MVHMKTKGLMLASLLFLVGCSQMCSPSRQDMTPEEVVQRYLDYSLNMTDVSQREYLVNLTTGSLRDALEQASEETLQNAFINQNFHLEGYSVVERRDRTPRETEITFLLTYRNLGPERALKPEEAPQISTENTVAVVKYKGAWAIRDVIGKTTTIDFPIEQAEEIRAAQ